MSQKMQVELENVARNRGVEIANSEDIIVVDVHNLKIQIQRFTKIRRGVIVQV